MIVSAMVSVRACLVLTCRLTDLRWAPRVRATVAAPFLDIVPTPKQGSFR